MSSLDYLDLCRLCLVKDQVSVPIFDGEGDVRQIFLKIAACLPVKLTRDDKLPKKICNDCVYKVELFYEFWNTTSNSEKQLMQWLGEVDVNDKQTYVTAVINQDQSSDNRLDGNVMQQTNEHQNNMGMNIIETMSLEMPMMMSTDQTQMTINTTNNSNSQSIQALPGTSAQQKDGMGESEEDNSDDDMDRDEGLPVKEEIIQDTNRIIEPGAFLNVSLPCDEPGPSGLQQQKNADIPDMVIGGQTTESDNKAGFFIPKLSMLSPSDCSVDEMKVLVDGTSELLMISGDDLQVPKTESSMEDISRNQHAQLIYCELCEEGLINEIELAQHIKTHETLGASVIAEIDDSDNNIDEDEDDDGKSIYVCEHCGRSFKTTIILKKHQQQVHNTTPDDIKFYNCDTCEYISSNEKNLQIHKKSHVQKLNTFNCDECGKSFYSRTALEEHQIIHNDEKPFQCNLCPATFRYRQGLRLHAKLHQPDYIPPQKKHLCELCNKRFSRKQVLLVHMRTHSNAGPQNEYVCHICNKSVSSKTYLTVHVRKHTGEKPHVCDLCNKAFISQNYLSVHRRTHTGERPHKCTHCEKRFTQRTTLVVHLRGHTGDRPYPCMYCIKSFASKTMLNSHLKTHAKQNARTQQDTLQNHDIIATSEQHLEDIHFELQDDIIEQDDVIAQNNIIEQDELSHQSKVEVLDNVLLQS